jgi:hypothetical protein
MKILTQRPPVRRARSAGCDGSANLPALLIGASILLVVVGAALSTHIFGVKMMHVVEAGRGLDDSTRQAIQKLEEDIRSAKDVQVGNGDAGKFTPVDSDSPQKGSALQIYPTNNTSQFVRYYRNSSDSTLNRIATGDRSPVQVAANILNAEIFTLEDHTGTVLTNQPNSRVVHTRLNFSKTATTGSAVGAGKGFDSFEINSRIAFSLW